MSTDDWDPIRHAIGSVLGGVVTAPLAPILGPLAPVLGTVIGGNMFGDGDAPQAPPPHPPAPAPAPGTAPPPPPAPGPLPPPPAGHVPASGEAAEKDSADAGTVADVIAQLQELDTSAAATIEAIHAAGTAGQQQLDNIGKDVDAKITELGPRLETPAGQQELRDFLKEKLSTAKKVLEEQIADAEAKARQTRELTEKYGEIGGSNSGEGGTEPASNGGGGGGSGESGSGGGGGGASPADQGTAPAAAPAAAPPAAGASPAGQGMMPGAGMMPAGMPMPSMPSMPSFGGGGMPGLGGDPLSALSGLGGGQGSGSEPGFRDDENAGDQQESGSSEAKFKDEVGPGLEESKPSPEGEPTAPAAAGGPAGPGEGAGTQTPTDPAASQPPATTNVALPNGESTEARTVQGATAARAALDGAPVADAWHQAGVNVPPPGTPVTDPIPPTKLKAGDVGVWQDHLVMALGDGKVLVSGQVQPLSSVGSSPDFLGWMDPSAQATKGAEPTAVTPPAPAAPPVPPVPPPAQSS